MADSDAGVIRASLTLQLPRSPAAPRSARRALERFADGRMSQTGLDSARLLVTELVTNAFRHGGLVEGDEIGVTITMSGELLRAEVTDPGRSATVPERRAPANGGWGLDLLDRIASRWGVAEGRPTRIWFELDSVVATSPEEAVRNSAADALRESEQRFRTVADAAPVLIWLADASGAMTFCNQRWLEFRGRTLEQESGGGWREGIHPDDLEHELPRHRTAFDAGKPFEMEYRLRRHDGVYRLMLERAVPLHRGGKLSGFIASAVDITEERAARDALSREHDRAVRLQQVTEDLYQAERRAREAAEDARERADFIADAAAVLDRSLDRHATLRALADVVAPRLADWCSIDLASADGTLEHVAVTHVDPDQVRLVQELRQRYPDAPRAHETMRSGEAHLYEDVSLALLTQIAVDGEHERILRALRIGSLMFVPLVARKRKLGVATLVRLVGRRRFTPADLATAQDVAARASLALDNARLYEERSELAWTLQSSLLPPALPELAGVELAARYRPAARGGEVGGDFYDVQLLPDDSVHVVVGDVCGKGAEAAALTSMARYTLRAIGHTVTDPADALRMLNAAVRRQVTDNRFISLAVCHISADRRSLAVAVAGHPPPLLLGGDSGVPIPARGWLLGIHAEPQLQTLTVPLQPGATLVLYTDGVTEANRTDPAEPAALAAELGPLAAAGPEAVAAALEEHALRASGGTLPDDVAILVARVD